MNRCSTGELPMTGEAALLARIKTLNEHAIRKLENFVFDGDVALLARTFDANLKKRDVELGFNLFTIVSDRYYQENFHSDILKALIDPKSKHGERDKYLNLFLNFIRSRGARITLSDYTHAQVVREEGRLDILIKDDASTKAIIIENKINNAGDMPRQLPRYLEYVKASGYSCDAIIYLRLNGHAEPDMTGWTDDEQRSVQALLKVICAYDETDNDLLNGWISKCGAKSNNPDVRHILRQYGALIKKLGGNIMNKPIMEKFYAIIVEGENLKTALSLKAMVDDLVPYRVERIIDTFRSDLAPFKKISNYNNYDAYFTNLMWNDAHLGLDIVVEPESYSFQFWDRNDPEGAKSQAKAMLQKMGCLGEYTSKQGKFTREFGFPSQEADLIQHIRDFKEKLATKV